MKKYRKLRAKMVEQGLSQTALADRIGLSLQSLNAKLCGRMEFTLPNVKAICRALNIPPSDIAVFFGDGA